MSPAPEFGEPDDSGPEPAATDDAAGGDEGHEAPAYSESRPTEVTTLGDDDPPAKEEASEGASERCGEYLDSLTRLKAEFANYRRRAGEQQAQAAQAGAAHLASRLLPVLDASEAGAEVNAELIGPLHNALLEALTDGGLEVISPHGEPFDPNYHEAVVHEAAAGDGTDGPTEGPMVTDVLRTGYSWGGKVLRPAMVGVRG